MCYNMIYLASLCNLPFSLFFGIQGVFRIYNNNLLCPRQIYTSPYKFHHSNNNF